jgi:hypothetical protein
MSPATPALPLPSVPAGSSTQASAPAAGPPGNCAFRDFPGFVQYLREPGLPIAVISPRRFAAALNVDLATLAAWAHVHRNTVQRAPGSVAVQAYLRHSLRVIRAAIDPHGGIEATLFWFRNEPLPTFEFETPAQTVSALGPEPLLLLLRNEQPLRLPSNGRVS